MIIAVASDHAGYAYKERVVRHLRAKGHEIRDFGTDSDESCDYPLLIRPAAEAVASGECDIGVVFGGSGNGEAMTANKVHGIRCAVCWDVDSARYAKQHNDANMIALGQRLIAEEQLPRIVDAWLSSAFEGGRHARRIALLE
ncbi:MAG: RpiB/LacA/LacB family sugar-phosphate isomerase [Verrucomicrobia bacterium]|nr:RpiB/LacA/LacB family sugar-phosphate isomerase [Verrucomicrobiota bacterium]MDA1086918.1 RpiB/LacA/LacB family sugar-phosphate isomerase [Verrucomicrobiota bacterium]